MASTETPDTNREIAALMHLLDEPDEKIYAKIRDKILSYGKIAIPVLEEAWSNNLLPEAQERIELLLHKLQFNNLIEELTNWKALGCSNLLKGYLLISKYQYPGLDEGAVKKLLEKIKTEIWLELNENLTALEKISVFNKIIFDINKFQGDKTDYHSPLNSYINNVLELRKGNPLSLSMVYIILADMLEIPVYGVNLPEHFILAYIDKKSNEDLNEENMKNVLFYINPFSNGVIFTRYEIEAFLKQIKYPVDEKYFVPCTNAEMIARMLRNLVYSYSKAGQKNKVAELEILLKIFI